MFHVRVLGAQNLPFPSNKVKKTKIYCFSFSSRRYFYDSFKSKEKTTDPEFNGEFDLDLFRAVSLNFVIYASQLLSKEIFIGRVDIDICNLLSQPIGKQIIGSPHSIVQAQFPITSCEAQNAVLLLSFSYSPSPYRSIEFKDVSRPTIHFWAEFNPPLPITSNDQIPVEIELLEATPNNDRKSGDLNVFFTNLNKYNTWETVGNSSNLHVTPSLTGPTQVHTFALSRVAGCYEFFILNSNMYNGTVTINFILEKKDKTKDFEDEPYYVVKDKKDEIGCVSSISLQVEANKKYCAPVYMHYEKKAFSKNIEFNEFPVVLYDKSKMANENDKSIEYSDVVSSQIPFHSEIMEKVRSTIPELKEANFMRLNALTNMIPISLSKTIKDFNLKVSDFVRIYIGGSTTERQQQNNMNHRSKHQPPITYYWEPRFIIYDMNNGSKCQQISKAVESTKETSYPSGKRFMNFESHTMINLDLNQIGTDKIIVFAIHCKSTLSEADSPGFFLITHFDGNQEMMMFRTPFYVDQSHAHNALCLRFEFHNDDWKIIPMRRYCKDDKEMEEIADTLHANHWETPDVLKAKLNGIQLSEDSDGD